jgi:hypothetical protein
VRTTLTIDDDVATLLEKERVHSGEPFKQVVNRILRSGLACEAKPAKLPAFKVRARKIGIPDHWFEASTQDLLDRLDGPFAR